MTTVKVGFSINTSELEEKYLYMYNHLNAAAICLRTSANQFSATTSVSTLETITGRKSETAIPRIIIWPAPRLGKMTQIACCDWLPERARWSYLARSGLPAVSRKQNFTKSHIINPLLTKFAR